MNKQERVFTTTANSPVSPVVRAVRGTVAQKAWATPSDRFVRWVGQAVEAFANNDKETFDFACAKASNHSHGNASESDVRQAVNEWFFSDAQNADEEE